MVQYRTDLFKAETIERMMSHFTQLLISVTKDPLQKVGTLPMLSPTEQQQLVAGLMLAA
jgi:non-ribosomal peptide synthetase component F